MLQYLAVFLHSLVYFSPVVSGVGIPGDLETAIHITHQHALTLDMKNLSINVVVLLFSNGLLKIFQRLLLRLSGATHNLLSFILLLDLSWLHLGYNKVTFGLYAFFCS